MNLDELRSAISTLISSEAPHAFVCCAADESGSKSLHIAPNKLAPAQLMKLMETAQDKALITGSVHSDGDQLVFEVERGDAEKLKSVVTELADQAEALSGFRLASETDDDEDDWDDEDDDWDDDDWDDDDWDDEDSNEDSDEDSDKDSDEDSDAETDNASEETGDDDSDDDWDDDDWDDDDWDDDEEDKEKEETTEPVEEDSDDDWDDDDWDDDDDDDDWDDDDGDGDDGTKTAPRASTPAPAAQPSLSETIAAIQSDATGVFVYCAADASGDPVLLIDPDKVPPKSVMGLMKTAKNKVLVMGKIQRHDGRLVFLANKPDHAQFADHLTDHFAREVAALSDAWIRPQGWSPEDETTATPESEPEPSPSEEAQPEPPEEEDISPEDWLKRSLAANAAISAASSAVETAQAALEKAEASSASTSAPLSGARQTMAKMREAMVERPQPGDARKLVGAIETLAQAHASARSGGDPVGEARQQLYTAHAARVEIIEAQRDVDEELGNALALAEASEIELPNLPPEPPPAPAAVTEESIGEPGDPAALKDPCIAEFKAIAKGVKDLKMRARGKSISEFVQTAVPSDSVIAIAAAAQTARIAGDEASATSAQAVLREVLTAAVATLSTALDTSRQIKQWEEWKDRFPPEQQACVVANSKAIGDLVGQIIDLSDPISRGL